LVLNDYDIECINKAKDFIDANFKRHHPIAEIATYAGISQTRLKAAFKEIFGKGLYEYLHEGAMLKARSLLENTNKTIKEISHIIGYKHPNNFCAAFKKRFGKAPRKWRIDNP